MVPLELHGPCVLFEKSLGGIVTGDVLHVGTE